MARLHSIRCGEALRRGQCHSTEPVRLFAQVKIFLATDDPDMHAEFQKARCTRLRGARSGTVTPMGLQMYGDSLLSVNGPIVHSGSDHNGLDERNQTPTLLSHQKVSNAWELPLQDAILSACLHKHVRGDPGHALGSGRLVLAVVVGNHDRCVAAAICHLSRVR